MKQVARHTSLYLAKYSVKGDFVLARLCNAASATYGRNYLKINGSKISALRRIRPRPGHGWGEYNPFWFHHFCHWFTFEGRTPWPLTKVPTLSWKKACQVSNQVRAPFKCCASTWTTALFWANNRTRKLCVEFNQSMVEPILRRSASNGLIHAERAPGHICCLPTVGTFRGGGGSMLVWNRLRQFVQRCVLSGRHTGPGLVAGCLPRDASPRVTWFPVPDCSQPR